MKANEVIRLLMGVPPASDVVVRPVDHGEAEGLNVEGRVAAAPLVILSLARESEAPRT